MGRLLDEDAVIKEIKEWQKAFRANCHRESVSDVNLILDAIKNLPPAEKTGHWIPHESIDGGIQYECSECGVLWEFNDGSPEDNEAYFCPKCGTRMKGERT